MEKKAPQSELSCLPGHRLKVKVIKSAHDLNNLYMYTKYEKFLQLMRDELQT